MNKVHTSWPAILIDGQEALMQPRMGDIHKVWTQHRADASKYPQLAQIKDHSGDGLYEVNTPAEIDALIAAITVFLEDNNYPMEGKKVAWAINNFYFYFDFYHCFIVS